MSVLHYDGSPFDLPPDGPMPTELADSADPWDLEIVDHQRPCGFHEIPRSEAETLVRTRRGYSIQDGDKES